MSIILAMAASFIITVILLLILIPLLRKLKIKQTVLEIGPSWHSSKVGLVTMGGICFIIAACVVTAYFYKSEGRGSLIMLLCAVACAMIGFVDDYFKVINKRNLGLKSWQKFSLQLLVSSVFVYVGLRTSLLSTVIEIPFTGNVFDMGMYYIPFALFVLTGSMNAVNITDGIDGLSTSVTIIVMIYFLAASCVIGTSNIFPSAIIGGLLGFLIFNAYPAKIIMGDTGSLFLGSCVAILGLTQGNPFVLAVIGFVYVMEIISVMIQVGYYKMTKKRFFKMAPIHHHFEMLGYSEVKIVVMASVITGALCIVALFGSGMLI